MKAPEIPVDEKERLQALRAYSILDTLPEEEFDDITRIASAICRTPISTITLIDSDRQWFKASQGMTRTETPREFAFCGHAINYKDEIFSVNDSRKDERFFDNPLVTGEPNVVFYAGVPLVSPEGFALGTLCVIDHEPRSLNEAEKKSLRALANQVVKLFELKKLNSLVALKEKQYRNLMDDVNDMIYELDENGKFRYINKSVVAKTGFAENEVLGKFYADLIYPEDREMAVNFYVKQLKSGQATSYLELRLLTTNNQGLWIGQNVKMVFEGNRVTKVAAIARDISQIREALSKVEEAAFAKSRFLGMMSHEIRTPLNGIIGITNILNDSNPRPDQQENLNLLKFSCDNLLTIINDVLDFNKIEAGKMHLEKIPMSLSEIAGQHVKMLSMKAKEKAIDLKLLLDPDLPRYVVSDPVRMGQVLDNLLGNAIKFTAKGYVHLSITQVGVEGSRHRIAFAVKDTGIGIPADKIDSIFTGFTQASSDTTRRFGGTGLGLSITRKLLEMMGSSIEVNSNPGKGSTFSFELEMEETTSAAEGEKKVVGQAGGLRILVVDDNRVNQIVTSNAIGKLGHTSIAAGSGDEAIQLLDAGEFDLVLMDLQMPDKDGYQTTQEIRSREDKYFKNVPIVALTADVLPEVKGKARKAGMNDYLVKPFQLSELVSIIDRHVPQKPGSGLKNKIRDIASGNETQTAELSRLLAENMKELQRAIHSSSTTGKMDAYDHALHRSKTALSVVGNGNLTEILNKVNGLFRRRDFTGVVAIKNEIDAAFSEVIEQLS